MRRGDGMKSDERWCDVKVEEKCEDVCRWGVREGDGGKE